MASAGVKTYHKPKLEKYGLLADVTMFSAKRGKKKSAEKSTSGDQKALQRYLNDTRQGG